MKRGAALAGLLLTGCRGFQSAIDPAGPQAGRIDSLWWFFFSVCAAVLLAVIAAMLYAVFRSRTAHTAEGAEPVFRRRVLAATVATAAILIAFLVVSVATGKAVSVFPSTQGLVIEVTGHQWWWEVRYPDQVPSRGIVTANEMHIPVGRPVLLRGTADDVIHSLWIPNLNGKRDLIPSRITTMWIQADRPGVFRAQCAEYCGLQHAHMAFYVVAERPEQFDAWLDGQREPAAEPADDLRRRGREVFLAQPCVLCHTIRGTGASGQVAPDLTHLASRRSIAAGTLPNNLGNLGGWIADSQNIKPGNRMPPITIPPGDMEALLAYLTSLE